MAAAAAVAAAAASCVHPRQLMQNDDAPPPPPENLLDATMTPEQTAADKKARGNYKCGVCGFAPKRIAHDCVAENNRRIAASTAAARLQASHAASGVFNGKQKNRGGYKCGVRSIYIM